jgi:hypothetical protein
MTATITMNKFSISPNYVYTSGISKRELWEQTIEVWDHLVENGYHPSDFSCGVVTVYVEGFARLVSETDGLASVTENNIYRTSAVWIGNIEINFTEFKKDRHGGWSLEEGWKPL